MFIISHYETQIKNPEMHNIHLLEWQQMKKEQRVKTSKWWESTETGWWECNDSASFLKINTQPPCDSHEATTPLTGIYPRKRKIMLVQNPVHIYINFDLEKPRTGINPDVHQPVHDKQTVVPAYQGMLLNTHTHTKAAVTHSSLDASLEIMLSEKSQS